MSDQFRGRLEVFGFADLLQWMELNRRSGRLAFTRGRETRLLDWREGEIVYVSGSLPRHRLGVHLLRSGALPAATLYDLLARNFTSQGNLSRLILEGGHDTLDGLSLRVEELARKLLFEMFEWHEASFDYDPSYRTEPILRIGLSLRGQAMAFHGVKKLDDTRRRRRGDRVEDPEDWEIPFRPEQTPERFWEVVDRAGEDLAPEQGRGAYKTFIEFTDRVRQRATSLAAMHPVHEDTADLLLELLKKTPVDAEAVVPVAALDPYLTLDFLILANALSVDRENSVGTVPDAIERIGSRAVHVLIERLSAPEFRRIPEDDTAARVLRRASVAAAIAAGRYAERYGVTRERGYTLGLLHAVGYAEMFEILRSMAFESRQLRAAALEVYRPALTAARAETWGLPLDFQWVLADDGSDPSAAAALIRTARAAVPGCAVGATGSEQLNPLWADEIAREVTVVFEFLGLGPVSVKAPSPD
jgi:HD-like signal output (HDOD) protein